MTDASSFHGPKMVIATSVMKLPPVRIGKIADGITLPRPVQLRVLLATGAGVIVGVFAAALVGGSLTSYLWGAAIFGAMGAFVVKYSPMQGESLFRWVELTFNSRRRAQIKVDGVPVRVAVGVCPIPRPALDGWVRITAGSVRVPSSQYDARGVRITAANDNLDEAAHAPVWTPPGAAPTATAWSPTTEG